MNQKQRDKQNHNIVEITTAANLEIPKFRKIKVLLLHSDFTPLNKQTKKAQV